MPYPSEKSIEHFIDINKADRGAQKHGKDGKYVSVGGASVPTSLESQKNIVGKTGSQIKKLKLKFGDSVSLSDRKGTFILIAPSKVGAGLVLMGNDGKKISMTKDEFYLKVKEKVSSIRGE